MGKISVHVYDELVPEEPDRHANRLSIYKSIGGQYRINFRNIQFRLSKKEFEEWKRGFARAKEKLGDLMQYDEIVPIEPEDSGRQRNARSDDHS